MSESSITVALADGSEAELTVGREYELAWRSPADARSDREARAGLHGTDKRGRLVFNGSPRFGDQVIDSRWVLRIAEVPWEDGLREGRYLRMVPRPGRPRAPGMRRSERAREVDLARVELADLLETFQAGHRLTDVEMLRAVAAWQATVLKFMPSGA